MTEQLCGTHQRSKDMNQLEREERQIEDDFAHGLISQAEYNAAMHDLQREYRAAAEEAAQQAYERELENW